MSRANEFLDKYNRLENLTEEKFDCGRYSPLIFLPTRGSSENTRRN